MKPLIELGTWVKIKSLSEPNIGLVSNIEKHLDERIFTIIISANGDYVYRLEKDLDDLVII